MTDVEIFEVTSTTKPSSALPENSHVVNCPDEYPSSVAYIAAAARNGQEITALCGFTWIPQGLAPNILPPCKPCLAEMERIATEVYGS